MKCRPGIRTVLRILNEEPDVVRRRVREKVDHDRAEIGFDDRLLVPHLVERQRRRKKLRSRRLRGRRFRTALFSSHRGGKHEECGDRKSKSRHRKASIISAMTLRFAAVAALLLAAIGCGGNNELPAKAELKVDTTHAAASSSDGAHVTGKVAPGLALPSAVVVLEPKSEAELPVKSEPAIMDQAGYEFLPGFLLAQAGQLVQFRNSEDVLHNVRVSEISS